MEKHISSQFDADLTSVSSRVLELGGLVESQTRHAVYELSVDQVIFFEDAQGGVHIQTRKGVQRLAQQTGGQIRRNAQFRRRQVSRTALLQA